MNVPYARTSGFARFYCTTDYLEVQRRSPEVRVVEESMLLHIERLRDALANIQQLREPDWLPEVTEGDEVLEEQAPPWLQAVIILLGKTRAEAERLTEKSEHVEGTLDSFQTMAEVFVSALWIQAHGFDAPTIKVCKGWRLVATD